MSFMTAILALAPTVFLPAAKRRDEGEITALKDALERAWRDRDVLKAELKAERKQTGAAIKAGRGLADELGRTREELGWTQEELRLTRSISDTLMRHALQDIGEGALADELRRTQEELRLTRSISDTLMRRALQDMGTLGRQPDLEAMRRAAICHCVPGRQELFYGDPGLAYRSQQAQYAAMQAAHAQHYQTFAAQMQNAWPAARE